MRGRVIVVAIWATLGMSLAVFGQHPRARPAPHPSATPPPPSPTPVAEATATPTATPRVLNRLLVDAVRRSQATRLVPTPTPEPTPFPGIPCKVDRDCESDACYDGVCCDQKCDGNCRSCALPGHVGICTAVPDGFDPRRACQIAIGGSPACGGACYGGQCAFPDVGTACGVCAACDGNGRCTATPADDSRCGVIDCSGLDTRCRRYSDLTAGRCGALGVCKIANDPATCVHYSQLPCT